MGGKNNQLIPTTFTGKELTQHRDDDDFYEDARFKAYKKKIVDFEALQEYLAAFPFKWKIKLVHDEPLGPWGTGGLPQMRLEGTLEGEGVLTGKFEVTFCGRRIEVALPPDRQAIFEKAVKQLPEK